MKHMMVHLAMACGVAFLGLHPVEATQTGIVTSWGGQVMPVVVQPGTRFKAIAAGDAHSMALKSDGTVVAWGVYGQRTVPVALSNVVAVAAGGSHSLALKSNGTIVAWGDNYYGQTNVPGGLSNVVVIAAGGWHSLALKSDGNVVAWGYNDNGQSTVPVALSNVVAIAAGGFHSLALVVLPAPTLQAQISGNNVILSWPIWAQNFSLQATTNLTDPGSWTTLADVPVIVNQQYTVTNPVVGGQRFYRLKQ
jgi:hypothetical protein